MSNIVIPQDLLDWILIQRRNNVHQDAVYQSMLSVGWSSEVALAAMQKSVNDKPAASNDHPSILVQNEINRLVVNGHAVDIVMNSKVPHVTVLDNFLTEDECNHLIELARPKMDRSRTVDRATGKDELNEVRTSTGTFLEKRVDDVVARVEERLAAICQWPENNGENLQILHYGVGAEYKPHYDYFEPDAPSTPTILKRGGQRVGTVVMYLNDPIAGGGTSFPDAGLYVSPKRGRAVFFAYPDPSPQGKSLHGGHPVVEGEKWVATKWWRQREFK